MNGRRGPNKLSALIKSDVTPIADPVTLSNLDIWRPHCFAGIQFFTDADGSVEATPTTGTISISIQTLNTEPQFETPPLETIEAASPHTVSWMANTNKVKATPSGINVATHYQLVVTCNENGNSISPLDRIAVTNMRPLDNKYGAVVRPILPRTSFGEIRVESGVPVIQMTAVYGITDRILSTTQLGGTVSIVNSEFICTTGTNANAVASFLSKRQIKYRAGQGIQARFTAMFDTPQVNSFQEAGLASNTDRIGFGYSGTDFGIIYSHGGETQIQELTVATGASGSENATITIDGTVLTVPLTAGDTIQNSQEIATSLNSQAPAWIFTANDSQVVARSFFAAVDAGAFAFSSATAVASWSQVKSGLNPTDDFIDQADWNIRTRPELDQTKLNVFQIQFQYLGGGAMFFSIENSMSGEYEIVHVLEYANANIKPNLSNPTFRIGWTIFNRGNTTSLTMMGSSAAIFNEGKIVHTEQPRSVNTTQDDVGITLTNILTIRSRIVFSTKTNRIETLLKTASALTDSLKGVIIEVLAGATFSAPLDFAYIDKSNSITEIATDKVTVSGGRSLGSFVVGVQGNSFDLEALETILLPGEDLTIAGRVVKTPISSISATLTFKEDI